MNVYVVVARPPAKKLADAVTAKYPRTHKVIVADTAWAIGTSEQTSADVCATLGIDTGAEHLSGVVIKVEQYYGVYDPALWQKMSAWERH